MSEYRIKKNPKKVEIHIVGADPVSGYVFLDSTCHRHHGAERVLDILINRGSFLPMEDEQKRLLLIHKGAITKVVVDAAYELEIHRSYGDKGLNPKPVVARLIDGQEIQGTLLIDPILGSSRSLDELNRARKFFPLICGEDVHLLATRYVALVREA